MKDFDIAFKIEEIKGLVKERLDFSKDQKDEDILDLVAELVFEKSSGRFLIL